MDEVALGLQRVGCEIERLWAVAGTMVHALEGLGWGVEGERW